MGKSKKRTGLAILVFTMMMLISSLLPVEALAADASVSVRIPIEKKVTPVDPSVVPASPATFEFTLEPRGVAPAMTVDHSIFITGEGTGEFVLTFDRAGDFDYIIRETGKLRFYQFDSSLYAIRVHVERSQDGRGLKASWSASKNEGTAKEDAILFENLYGQKFGYDEQGGNPIQGVPRVTFSAKKTLDGQMPGRNDFRFVLRDEEGNVLQRKYNYGEDVVFDAMVLPGEGRYVFTISEEAGGDGSIIYDESVYTAIVNVEGFGTDQTLSVRYEKNGRNYPGIPQFNNLTDDVVFTRSASRVTTGAPVSSDASSATGAPVSSAASTLPQTGMLWWPVWILSIAGIGLLIIGWLLKRDNKRRNK